MGQLREEKKLNAQSLKEKSRRIVSKDTSPTVKTSNIDDKCPHENLSNRSRLTATKSTSSQHDDRPNVDQIEREIQKYDPNQDSCQIKVANVDDSHQLKKSTARINTEDGNVWVNGSHYRGVVPTSEELSHSLNSERLVQTHSKNESLKQNTKTNPQKYVGRHQVTRNESPSKNKSNLHPKFSGSAAVHRGRVGKRHTPSSLTRREKFERASKSISPPPPVQIPRKAVVHAQAEIGFDFELD